MFDRIALHGGTATLLWGYRTAAALTSWRITRHEAAWTLTATVARADAWQCGQAAKHRELLFTAPRERGRWCWPVTDIELGPNQLRATLGQPLQ